METAEQRSYALQNEQQFIEHFRNGEQKQRLLTQRSDFEETFQVELFDT